MNIQELRSKYPQYNNISDQELADKLHSKYYSNLPKTDVYKKLGIQEVKSNDFYANTPFGNQQVGDIPAGQVKTLEDLSGASGHELKDGKWSKIPKLSKQIEMIGSGAAQGSLEFTTNLIGLAEKLTGTTYAKDAYKYWNDKNKKDAEEYDSNLPALGQLAGQALTTAPVGSLLGMTGKAAAVAGAASPVAKTAATYGTSSLLGGGVLAGLEGLRHDPNNPNTVINTDNIKDALTSPSTYLAPAAGTALERYMGKSRVLGEMKEIDPKATMNNTRGSINPNTGNYVPTGLEKTNNQIFGFYSSLTSHGHDVKQLEGVGDILHGYVQKIAGAINDTRPESLKKKAANMIDQSLKATKLKGDLLWEQVPKKNPIVDSQGLKDNTIEAIDLIKGTAIDDKTKLTTFMTNQIRKGKLTVEDAKKINTQLGSAIDNAFAAPKGAGLDLADALLNIKDKITGQIQNSLDDAGKEALAKANQYTANYYKMRGSANKMEKAVIAETGARTLLNDFLSETGQVSKDSVKGMIKDVSPNTADKFQNTAAAAFLKDAMLKANQGGKFNIGSFLDTTNGAMKQVPEIIGKDNYKTLEGMRKYLGSVNEMSKTGWWKSAAVATGLGVPAAIGGLAAGGPAGLAAVIASYGALHLAVKHSPIKTLLHGLTKDLPKSTFDEVTRAVQKHFTRYGYLINENGELVHKEENDE